MVNSSLYGKAVKTGTCDSGVGGGSPSFPSRKAQILLMDGGVKYHEEQSYIRSFGCNGRDDTGI
jgi:hypothetical protein